MRALLRDALWAWHYARTSRRVQSNLRRYLELSNTPVVAMTPALYWEWDMRRRQEWSHEGV